MEIAGDDGAVPRADLLVVGAAVPLVLAVAFTPLGGWRPLAILVGLPFVLLLPGYAVVSAMFPRAGEVGAGPGTGTSVLARVLLSVGGSVIAVSVAGVALDFTALGFQREAVVGALAGLTVAATAVAWYRRRQVPADVRAGVSLAAVRKRTRAVVVGTGPVSILLTLLVVAVAAGGIAVVAEDATSSGSVTEFYILGESESGDLVAGAYPTNLTVGEPTTLGVGVGTRGQAGFDGYVVASLERVSGGDGSVTVEESRQLDRFDVGVGSGETTVRRHTVQPSMAGERLRLTYRLYERGTDSPFRRVQLRVTVSPQR